MSNGYIQACLRCRRLFRARRRGAFLCSGACRVWWHRHRGSGTHLTFERAAADSGASLHGVAEMLALRRLGGKPPDDDADVQALIRERLGSARAQS